MVAWFPFGRQALLEPFWLVPHRDLRTYLAEHYYSIILKQKLLHCHFQYNGNGKIALKTVTLILPITNPGCNTGKPRRHIVIDGLQFEEP